MEKEYYTPNIDEFYPGVEFEIYHEPIKWIGSPDKWNKWIKYIFGPKDESLFFEDITGINYFIEKCPKEIRIKYLDSEDIQECGFIKSVQSGNLFLKEECYHFGPKGNKTGVGINFYSPLTKCTIFIIHEDSTRIAGIPIFNGVIKNKFELKKLIKMLNIK